MYITLQTRPVPMQCCRIKSKRDIKQKNVPINNNASALLLYAAYFRCIYLLQTIPVSTSLHRLPIFFKNISFYYSSTLSVIKCCPLDN